MVSSIIELRNVAGTEAAMGWAGSHTLVVDRPEGKAGGLGLGFNGAQLLALAIGGCFCNDLRYVAHDMGIEIDAIAVRVTLELDGSPLITTRADLDVTCTSRDRIDTSALIDRARRVCTVANSVMRGFPVSFRTADQSPRQ
ncbi:OsmC family protein [Neorhizobium petrolearium]|uniref:OsmC family protein n=1 Tax=Neorhizobium petrolearium TaxID=515361 RepID=A0ABY8M8K9_9HYPH|nr:OsmC family protein [Neorhizobium petrolearium]MCC2610753.1 OsmC family protein [Neorhizobium petrolearium]WGI70877.1 OsmC family protein [Neorhizobium petrolearium]